MATESKSQMGHEPDLNRLAALAEGRLDAQAHQELTEHLADCRQCREIVALLARREPTAAARTTRWTRPMTWLPIAASLVIASIAVLLLSPERSPLAPSPQPSTGSDQTLPAERGSPAPGDAPTPRGSSPEPGQSAGDLSQRRTAGIREVGSKTFRLVAGEWVDSSYDPNAVLPVVQVSGPDRRRELLEKIPPLGPYADIGERVTVVYEGTVYKIVR